MEYERHDTIGRRYRVHEVVGPGEYLCLDVVERRPVALRAMGELGQDEAVAWVQLPPHPNVLACYGIKMLDDEQFLILPWIVGRPLNMEALSEEEQRRAIIDVTRGKAHAEAAGLYATGPLLDDSGVVVLTVVRSLAASDDANAATRLEKLENGYTAADGGPLRTPHLGALRASRIGSAFMALERYEDARDAFTQAIEQAPDEAHYYYQRADAHDRLEHFQSALDDLGAAIERDPDCYDAYTRRGAIYADQRRLDEAIADLKRALELAPDDPDAFFNVGTLLGHQERYEEALPYLMKAASMGNGPAALMAQQIRDELHVPPPTPMAVRAFQLAETHEKLLAAVREFPFMLEDAFMQAIDEAIHRQVPEDIKPLYRQRLAWLRNLAERKEQT